jgi:hypothetical protein
MALRPPHERTNDTISISLCKFHAIISNEKFLYDSKMLKSGLAIVDWDYEEVYTKL